MRSVFEHKLWVIFLSLLGLGALTMLAVGLRDLSFRDGQSFFGGNQIGDVRTLPAAIARSIGEVPFLTQLTMWGIFVLMFVLLALLMSPEWRKRLIRIVIRVAVIYWALYIVFTRYGEMLAEMGVDPQAGNGAAPVSASADGGPPAFLTPQTLSVASYIFSFALALLLLFVTWKTYQFWKEVRAAASSQPLKKIAKIARSSIDDLSSGRNSSDVIINCYFQMSDAVADARKIQRDASMTPGEFASRLEAAGLPSDAVKRLTRLFEGVRYGGRRSSPPEVNEAVACLTTILKHCGASA